MKKIMALLLMVAVMLSLYACDSSAPSGKIPAEPGDSYIGGDLEQTTSSQAQQEAPMSVPAQQFSNDGRASIDLLREEIARVGAIFGVAYLGSYFHGEMTYDEWFESTAYDLIGCYPFVGEIDKEHTIGDSGHMYCIIGGDLGDTITVKTLDGQVLYEATNGNPILVFCSRDGEGMIADTIVTVATNDGTEYPWEARLDQIDSPALLIDETRQVLSWDFTYRYDPGVELTGWLYEGWLGPTEIGLAGTDVFEGMSWWIYTDESPQMRYCLSFYPNAAHSYDGEVTMECFYVDDDTVLAEWQGWWYLDTVMDYASWLHMDLMLLDGADKEAFSDSAVIAENYMVLISPSGEDLLLVSDTTQTVLPFLQKSWRFATLSLAMG